MAKISIIVPIYNVEDYLKQALESIVLQNQSEIEIILVNDGSTDQSGKIAQNYAETYSNIKLVSKENGGLSSARNTGLALASGDYIMFLDSDDYLERDSLITIQDKLQNGKYDLVLFSGQKIIESRNGDVNRQAYGATINATYDNGVQAYKHLYSSKNYYTCVWFYAVRRKLLVDNRIEFLNNILHEDHLFTFQVFMAAGSVCCCSDVLYNYRIRENSIMTKHKQNDKRFIGFAKTCENMLKQVKDTDLENRLEIENAKVVYDKHLSVLATIAAKYEIKMSKQEVQKTRDVINMFKNLVCSRQLNLQFPYREIFLLKDKLMIGQTKGMKG